MPGLSVDNNRRLINQGGVIMVWGSFNPRHKRFSHILKDSPSKDTILGVSCITCVLGNQVSDKNAENFRVCRGNSVLVTRDMIEEDNKALTSPTEKGVRRGTILHSTASRGFPVSLLMLYALMFHLALQSVFSEFAT